MCDKIRLNSGITDPITKQFIKWFWKHVYHDSNSFTKQVLDLDEKDGELIYVVGEHAGTYKRFVENGTWGYNFTPITTEQITKSFHRGYKTIRKFIADTDATWCNQYRLCKKTGTSNAVHPFCDDIYTPGYYENERVFPKDEVLKFTF